MTLQDRLAAVMEHGGLLISELADWLEVSRTSLQGWLKGTTPRPPTKKKLERKLVHIERAISEVGEPFVPEKYNQRQRNGYLRLQKTKYQKRATNHDA